MSNRRVGVFGGTFDPIHAGHILVAQEAHRKHDLNKVIFVPAGDPWQKTDRTITPAEHRWTMLIEALAPHRSWASMSNVDIIRDGPTYTVDTLSILGNPDEDLFLIIGDDVDILTWKDHERIHELATVSRFERWLNLSSTMIRERIQRGHPCVPLIHEEVYEYILDQDLYRGE